MNPVNRLSELCTLVQQYRMVSIAEIILTVAKASPQSTYYSLNVLLPEEELDKGNHSLYNPSQQRSAVNGRSP